MVCYMLMRYIDSTLWARPMSWSQNKTTNLWNQPSFTLALQPRGKTPVVPQQCSRTDIVIYPLSFPASTKEGDTPATYPFLSTQEERTTTCICSAYICSNYYLRAWLQPPANTKDTDRPATYPFLHPNPPPKRKEQTTCSIILNTLKAWLQLPANTKDNDTPATYPFLHAPAKRKKKNTCLF